MTTSFIEVAVGVIRYKNQFLIARRHAHQHEGGKLEFIGGKLQAGEKPKTALVRETLEEIGLDISHQTTVLLGTIVHQYDTKAVKLWVYEIGLDKPSHLAFLGIQQGRESQSVFWCGLDELFAQKSNFPCANEQIFDWISLK